MPKHTVPYFHKEHSKDICDQNNEAMSSYPNITPSTLNNDDIERLLLDVIYLTYLTCSDGFAALLSNILVLFLSAF